MNIIFFINYKNKEQPIETFEIKQLYKQVRDEGRGVIISKPLLFCIDNGMFLEFCRNPHFNPKCANTFCLVRITRHEPEKGRDPGVSSKNYQYPNT